MKKIAIPLAMLLLLGAVVLLRPKSQAGDRSASRGAPGTKTEEEAIAVPPREQVPPSEAGKALHDSTLLGMIQNAKVADLKGDAVTRNAMLEGLKREPASARRLVTQEIAKASDSNDVSALNRLLAEIP